MTGVHKLSPDGELLWSQSPDPAWQARFPDGPAVLGDSVYVATSKGQLCAYNRANGELRWVKKFYAQTGSDSKYVTGHNGVLVMGTDAAGPDGGGGSRHVLGVDSVDGSLLWDFAPDTPTWNNMGMFTADDRVVFQDWDARVYCLGLRNGTLLWSAGGRTRQEKLVSVPPYAETWTDGGTIIGADGVVYAASSSGPQDDHLLGGGVHAYRLSDGKLLWEKNLSYAFLTWPVAAKLDGDDGFTLFVFPGAGPAFPWQIIFFSVQLPAFFALCVPCCGCQLFCFCLGGCKWVRRPRCCMFVSFIIWYVLASVCGAYAVGVYKKARVPRPSEIIALNADTGDQKWRYALPAWDFVAARGDEEGFLRRLPRLPDRPICLPVAFSSPSVDGNGTVFIGTQSGIVYGVKDANKDGVISDSEVVTFDAEASFLHSGPAFAPGMFAFTTCDSLFVWRF